MWQQSIMMVISPMIFVKMTPWKSSYWTPWKNRVGNWLRKERLLQHSGTGSYGLIKAVNYQVLTRDLCM